MDVMIAIGLQVIVAGLIVGILLLWKRHRKRRGK